MTQYRTVEIESQDEFTEKRSRFIGYVCPVNTADEANAFIQKISKKHWDAKHNVFAYILKDGNIKKYSDDGEPQGTAGVPVLDVLEKENLYNVCVVVTRYFGGVLLGGGGLVRAYSHAAKIAVDAGQIVTMALCCVMRLETDYTFFGKIAAIVSEFDAVVVNTEYADSVAVTLCVSDEKQQQFSAKVFDLSNGRYKPVELKKEYRILK